MWICINMQKTRLFHWFFLEIWSISQEPEFSQIWNLCRNTANKINFNYRTNSVKINDKSFQYIQKTLFLAHFWPIFPIFWAKNFFLENLALSRTTSYGFLVSCQNLEKTNNTIPRKRLDRRTEGQKDGRKDRQTLLHRTLPANAGGPIKKFNNEGVYIFWPSRQ